MAAYFPGYSIPTPVSNTSPGGTSPGSGSSYMEPVTIQAHEIVTMLDGTIVMSEVITS